MDRGIAEESIEIDAERAAAILADVPYGKSFQLSDGRTLKNLYELHEAASDMSNETFTHHTSQKNDFSSWVRYVHKDEGLAKRLEEAKTKEEIGRFVREHIEILQKARGIKEKPAEKKGNAKAMAKNMSDIKGGSAKDNKVKEENAGDNKGAKENTDAKNKIVKEGNRNVKENNTVAKRVILRKAKTIMPGPIKLKGAKPLTIKPVSVRKAEVKQSFGWLAAIGKRKNAEKRLCQHSYFMKCTMTHFLLGAIAGFLLGILIASI